MAAHGSATACRWAGHRCGRGSGARGVLQHVASFFGLHAIASATAVRARTKNILLSAMILNSAAAAGGAHACVGSGAAAEGSGRGREWIGVWRRRGGGACAAPGEGWRTTAREREWFWLRLQSGAATMVP